MSARTWPHASPARSIGVGVAWLLAAHISDAAVRLFTGVAALAFVLYNWLGPPRVAAKDVEAAACVAGAVLGRAVGLHLDRRQAGGPPYQIYVLPQQAAKMTFVGTTASSSPRMNWFKVVPYVALGQFSTRGSPRRWCCCRWRSPPTCSASGWCGVTPQELFYRITSC